MLEGVSRKDLEQRAGRISAAYRDGGTSGGITSSADALAYLVTRAPATYAAIRAVFARVAEAMPDFSPSSLLDVGAGPGTATWAARDAWPSLAAMTLIEPNAMFRDLAARLLPEAQVIAGDLGADKPRADLVTASYVLAELPEKAAAGTARDLWSGGGADAGAGRAGNARGVRAHPGRARGLDRSGWACRGAVHA